MCQYFKWDEIYINSFLDLNLLDGQIFTYNNVTLSSTLKNKFTLIYVSQNGDLIDYNPRSQGHVPINQLWLTHLNKRTLYCYEVNTYF